jgi:hypothetical protein
MTPLPAVLGGNELVASRLDCARIEPGKAAARVN